MAKTKKWSERRAKGNHRAEKRSEATESNGDTLSIRIKIRKRTRIRSKEALVVVESVFATGARPFLSLRTAML